MELRKLSPGVVFELCRILDTGEAWKQLMAVITVEDDPDLHKYSVEHMK